MKNINVEDGPWFHVELTNMHPISSSVLAYFNIPVMTFEWTQEKNVLETVRAGKAETNIDITVRILLTKDMIPREYKGVGLFGINHGERRISSIERRIQSVLFCKFPIIRLNRGKRMDRIET